MKEKNKIKAQAFLKLIRFYETEYLFFDKIKEYDKEKLLGGKYIYLTEVNHWLKSNYIEDKYTKMERLHPGYKSSFYADQIIKDVLYLKIGYLTDEEYRKIGFYITESKTDYLIMDMRNCAGGSVEAAIRIAELFIMKGEICSLHYLKGTQTFHSKKESVRQFKNIYIMTNQYTMSSAEILIMAMAMNQNNVYIVGCETYKKNIGQKVLTLKRDSIRFSYSAFEWRVHGFGIGNLYPFLLNEERMIELTFTADYNDYILQIYNHIRGVSSADNTSSRVVHGD